MADRPTVQQIFQRIHAVWDATRGSAAMPRRADIDPVQFRTHLPYIALLDVVAGDPIDFRYRLLGQQVITGFGSNITGGLHTQHADKSTPVWPFFDAYKRCVATRQPQDIDSEFRNHNKTLVKMRARVWPLSDDGETVTGLLGGGMFVAPEFR